MTTNATASTPSGSRPACSAPWLAILLVTTSLCLTSSCVRGTRPTAVIPQEVLALVTPLPPIGADLKAPCPDRLPEAPRGSNLEQLGSNHIASAHLYHDCKDKQHRLATAAADRERLERERIERARRALADKLGDR